MKNRQPSATQWDANRREFLRGTSAASLFAMMGGVPLIAQQPAPASSPAEAKPATKKPLVKCGVIGLGPQGRELLTALSKLPNAPVLGICDHYPSMVRRAKELAPEAQTYEDYPSLLANKEIKAVLIATPTHQHREIVEAALAAGKHVYCEAPLAHTLEDARAIAQAALKRPRLNFQPGLQRRSDYQHHFFLTFLRTGAMGTPIKARAQWAKKTSWRRSSPTEAREKELNWRLINATSTGLVGEIGIHQVDTVSWLLKRRPRAVTGYGSVQLYRDDGREVFDTVQAFFEFPNQVNFFYDATLANSFESEYETIYGSDAAVLVRGAKAWMFKESDSPLLGWEVYARKDEGIAYKESGIALSANATKIAAQGKQQEELPFLQTALQQAVEAFIANTNTLSAAVEDYDMAFDAKDEKALREYLDGPDLRKSRLNAASVQEGFEATVLVIKANEAIVKGTKITFADEWFQV